MPFTPSIQSDPKADQPKLWFIFQGDRLLVRTVENINYLPLTRDLEGMKLKILRQQCLGNLDGEDCFSAEVDKEQVAPEGYAFYGLRSQSGRLSTEHFAIAGYAFQIVLWDQTHQFCGSCGATNKERSHERAKICPACNLINYPKLAPAIIVAIVKDDQILLARSSKFPEGFFSVLAGFVEPGESLEQCVCREVKEEVNIEVDNIRYFGSQPWPFPNSLMIGFIADYKSGEIEVDLEEIAEAHWYSLKTLPHIPGSISIARQLIDWFIDRQSPET